MGYTCITIETMPYKFRKLGRAAGEGAKEVIAISLISLGMQQIQAGDYIGGGALVAIGWVLLVIDRYIL